MKPKSLWLCKDCEVSLAYGDTFMTRVCPGCKKVMVRGFLKFNLETADFEVLDAEEVAQLPGDTNAY